MTEKPKKLSETARALLTAAAARDDHLIRPPQLPAAAARQVVRSLLSTGLAEEVPAPVEDAGYVWRQGEDGSDLMLYRLRDKAGQTDYLSGTRISADGHVTYLAAKDITLAPSHDWKSPAFFVDLARKKPAAAAAQSKGVRLEVVICFAIFQYQLALIT